MLIHQILLIILILDMLLRSIFRKKSQILAFPYVEVEMALT